MFDKASCDTALDAQQLKNRFYEIRQCSQDLVSGLSEADVQLQAMADVSPTKWHLAHTTWFFETFILKSFVADYAVFNPSYEYLFNSYYNSIGQQYPRAQRGLISRPSLAEVLEYRQTIDELIIKLLSDNLTMRNKQLAYFVELGLQHEQQHQELLLTDIKYNFYQNPSFPQYSTTEGSASATASPLEWLTLEASLREIGFNAIDSSFCFDNEKPRHRVFVEKFDIANRLVTNGEFLAFMESGAYEDPQYWLADGWAWRQKQDYPSYAAPLYWIWQDDHWHEFTLMGLQLLDINAPVTHVNYFEANAYANWAGARLLTEFEWEFAAQHFDTRPKVNPATTHPRYSTIAPSPLQQMFGSVWQWTSSNYGAYPGFTPFEGDAGEYNGKFMSNQYVLRGSSCATPSSHARVTYRNFFYAHQAWQFTGIRLAR